MSKVYLLLLAFFVVSGPLAAQSLTTGPIGLPLPAVRATESIDLTRFLTDGPAGQAALADYHSRRKQGLPPAGKRTGIDAIGSQQGFQVFNWVLNAYEEVEFTLKVETARFNIWVENAELASGRMDNDKIESLRVALQDETPSGSFDPAMGVIDLAEFVFGIPTDVDASGKSDVLVLDIQDGFDPAVGGPSIGGFVDPSNLSGRNLRDILHLDTFPSLAAGQNVNNLYLTAAHEYQHLIRFAYDERELVFVDEGMSEWAEVMMGFGPRPNTYWSIDQELRRPLLGWRGNSDPAVDFDYQRAGLLTNYIAQRIGVLATGAITRLAAIGASGYAAALSAQGLNLETVLAEFQVANKVNDAAVNPFYSQGSWFTQVSAASAIVYDGTSQTSAGVDANGVGANPGPLEPGSATYHTWEDVAEFTLDFDALPGAGTVQSIRGRLRAYLVGDSPTSGISVTEISLGGEPVTLSGEYSEVTLVVAHVNASLPGGLNSSWAPFTYNSSWTEGSLGANTTTVAYDDGSIIVTNQASPIELLAFAFSTAAQVANRFAVPSGSVLSGVEIANLYADIFDPALDGLPRDYTLKVYDQNSVTGGPGSVLLELNLPDTSPVFSSLPQLGFDEVDLTQHTAVLAAAGNTIFVSTGNAGSDQNTLLWPMTSFPGTLENNPGWLFFDFGGGIRWAPFSAITSNDQPIFDGRVAPIRASFSFATADEDEPEIPSAVSLGANYPNPFNPRTSISFQMPSTSLARLAVYDMLGREVAVLVNGVTSTGRHEVTFDASKLASGLYLYALEAGGTRITRTMVLLK